MRSFALIIVLCSGFAACAQPPVPLTMETAQDALRRLKAAELQITSLRASERYLQERVKHLQAEIDTLKAGQKPLPKLSEDNGPNPFDNVVPSTEQVAKPKSDPPTIKLLSLPNCGPCDRWWNENAQKLREQGWVMERVTVTSGRTPRFEICWNNQCRPYQGWLTMAEIVRIVYPNGIPSDQASTQIIDRSWWTHKTPDDYRERWSYPGDIRAHLAGEPHNYRVPAGWTEEQCEQYHDQQHDVIGPWPK